MKTKTRILSIDGGGIKGIVPAVVLTHLEKCLKQLSNNPDARIIDYFDLFSGASTGAIIIADSHLTIMTVQNIVLTKL
tara:strand:+ start:415 stop:648 length:234 start_codon:yes stop_codon:yes gene_type:complete